MTFDRVEYLFAMLHPSSREFIRKSHVQTMAIVWGIGRSAKWLLELNVGPLVREKGKTVKEVLQKQVLRLIRSVNAARRLVDEVVKGKKYRNAARQIKSKKAMVPAQRFVNAVNDFAADRLWRAEKLRKDVVTRALMHFHGLGVYAKSLQKRGNYYQH